MAQFSSMISWVVDCFSIDFGDLDFDITDAEVWANLEYGQDREPSGEDEPDGKAQEGDEQAKSIGANDGKEIENAKESEEKAAAEKLAAEKEAAAKAAAEEKAAAEKLAAEKLAAEKAAAEKAAAEKAAAEKAAAEKAAAEKAAAEKAAAEKAAAEKAAAEKAAAEKAAAEKAAAEKAAAEKAAAEKAAAEKAAAEKAAAEKAAAEKAAAEKAAAEKAAAEKAAAEKAAAEKAAAEKAAAEKAAAEKLAAEKLAAEKAAAEKAAAEKAAAEKAAAEKLAAEKLAVEKAAKENLNAEVSKLASIFFKANIPQDVWTALNKKKALAVEAIKSNTLEVAKSAVQEFRNSVGEAIPDEKALAEKAAAQKLAAEKLAAEKVARNKLNEEASKLAETFNAAKIPQDVWTALNKKKALAIEAIKSKTLEEANLAVQEFRNSVGEAVPDEKALAEQLAAENLAREKYLAERSAAEQEVEAQKAARKTVVIQILQVQLAQLPVGEYQLVGSGNKHFNDYYCIASNKNEVIDLFKASYQGLSVSESKPTADHVLINLDRSYYRGPNENASEKKLLSEFAFPRLRAWVNYTNDKKETINNVSFDHCGPG